MQTPTDRLDRRFAIGIATLVLLLLGACDGGGDPPTMDQSPMATGAPGEAAEEIATGFFEAFGAFDADRATGYLAEDAEISKLLIGSESVDGAEEELRLNLSILQAQGYEQQLGSCEQTGTSVAGIGVRCPFAFHLFGSDEIGRGPYGGSYFDVTVSDGEIVRGFVSYDTAEFSPEMWEPFAEWVSTTYPDDAAVMYTDGSYTGVLISEESIRLWGRVRGGSGELSRQAEREGHSASQAWATWCTSGPTLGFPHWSGSGGIGQGQVQRFYLSDVTYGGETHLFVAVVYPDDPADVEGVPTARRERHGEVQVPATGRVNAVTASRAGGSRGGEPPDINAWSTGGADRPPARGRR